MSSDVVERLKNDPEFIKKVAEAVANNIIVSKLEEIDKKINYLMDQNKLIWEKFLNQDQKFNKILEDMKKEDERHNAEMERLDKRIDETINMFKKEVTDLREEVTGVKRETMSLRQEVTNLRNDVKDMKKDIRLIKKDIRDIKRTIEGLSISIEDEAIDFLTYKLKKEYNITAIVQSLEIPKVVEIDLYAEHNDYVFIGEVKMRAGVKAITQLENAIEKLLKVKPELSKKKVIPIIYAKRVTFELIDECKKRGIYLTNGISDITPLVL